jgi:hypothetical protein
MDEHGDDFDAYLREFRPRAPARRLDLTTRHHRGYRMWLMAAAVLLISVGTYVALPGLRGPGALNEATPSVSLDASDPSNLALGRLTRAAIADPDELDAALLKASPLILPDVAQPESALHVLARDED